MRFVAQVRIALGMMLAFSMGVPPCFAGEIAVLKNGFSIKHERREVVGDVTRLYVNADGTSFVDVPTAEIEHYEAAAEERATNYRPPVPASLSGNHGFPVRPQTDLNTVVNEASGRYRLDPDLVNSVIKAESDFNVHAVSRKGAQGLMQLMPGTASQLGVANSFDAQANVEGGTKYLRALMEKYNFDMVRALAAYNAGPQRVEQFGGVPPYYETKAYVARIVKDFNKKKMAEAAAAKGRATKVANNSSTRSTPTASQNANAKANSVHGNE
jgi:soluble lytic murein transglycosylase-like protein